jgi:predicted AlkP superfamily phosphohydrolase/phosphomutase
LLFGADGFEWSVALPMIRQGKLPTIASLMERGTCGRLATYHPTRSPIIWTSVATGKTPEKHGIEDFVYRVPANPQELNLFTSADRRTKAFWNILTDYGRTVGVVGWWMTFPVEPINGVMVAQTNTVEQLRTAYAENIWKGTLHVGVDGQVYPPQRQKEMIELLLACEKELPALTERIFGTFKHPQSELTRRLWKNCQWAFRADATYISIAERLISQEDRPEVLAVYMGGPDVVGHRYWRYMFPDQFKHRPTDAELEDYHDIIADYYAYTDQCLAKLLDAYGTDVTVIVASDHGMRAGNVEQYFDPEVLPANVNSGEHRGGPPGVVVMAGPRIRRTPLPKPLTELNKDALPVLCSIYDITPTILVLLGIPVGEDMDGQPVTAAIDAEWLEKHPVRTVGSHDTVAWLEARPQTKLQSPDKKARLDQLRALGYIK